MLLLQGSCLYARLVLLGQTEGRKDRRILYLLVPPDPAPCHPSSSEFFCLAPTSGGGPSHDVSVTWLFHAHLLSWHETMKQKVQGWGRSLHTSMGSRADLCCGQRREKQLIRGRERASSRHSELTFPSCHGLSSFESWTPFEHLWALGIPPSKNHACSHTCTCICTNTHVFFVQSQGFMGTLGVHGIKISCSEMLGIKAYSCLLKYAPRPLN